MFDPEKISRWEGRVRPLLTKMPSSWAVRCYSLGRKIFLKELCSATPPLYHPPPNAQKILWDISFRVPLMNAAGMFKNGEGYTCCAHQGAGGFLLGTTTAKPRAGNKRRGILHPFAPYARSGAASNWLGLPNEGHLAVAKRLTGLKRLDGCPIGASLMTDPDLDKHEALLGLVAGMKSYEDAGVDFIEINESCPNAGHQHKDDNQLFERLDFVQKHFLRQRKKHTPVIVKFSNDIEPQALAKSLDCLVQLQFDGINLGNTSTSYSKVRELIEPSETRLFDFFVSSFGGGVSGRPLKNTSLHIASRAVQLVNELRPVHEFHVIRTGGVESYEDILASENAGIALNQWFSGYFEAFSLDGHRLYERLFEKILDAHRQP